MIKFHSFLKLFVFIFVIFLCCNVNASNEVKKTVIKTTTLTGSYSCTRLECTFDATNKKSYSMTADSWTTLGKSDCCDEEDICQVTAEIEHDNHIVKINNVKKIKGSSSCMEYTL